MLWVINGLIYGFFMALYTLVNQGKKFNGYVLGIWRGFGIAILFAPALFWVPPVEDWRVWALLVLQGIFIGIYDSHIFFASARYGANTTSRLLVLSVLLTTILWWIITPKRFVQLFEDGAVFITLILCMSGFCICYWNMLRSKITRDAFGYMMPAITALAFMSVATKEIALISDNVWHGIIYYLTVATAISGIYNLVWLLIKKPIKQPLKTMIFAPQVMRTGLYIVSFSAALIVAKTLALRISPNPGYVVTLLLTAPLFVYVLSPKADNPAKVTEKAGWAMLFFLALIMLLVNSGKGIYD